MVEKTTKKHLESNLAQGGHYSVVADNMSKTRKHVQYSVASENIETTETAKTQKKRRTKNI